MRRALSRIESAELAGFEQGLEIAEEDREALGRLERLQNDLFGRAREGGVGHRQQGSLA
jgi:hypothetical protein